MDSLKYQVKTFFFSWFLNGFLLNWFWLWTEGEWEAERGAWCIMGCHVGVFVCVSVNADHWSRSCSGGVSSCGGPLDVWGQLGIYQGPCQHCCCDAGSCTALPHHSDHDPGMYNCILFLMLHSHNVSTIGRTILIMKDKPSTFDYTVLNELKNWVVENIA